MLHTNRLLQIALRSSRYQLKTDTTTTYKIMEKSLWKLHRGKLLFLTPEKEKPRGFSLPTTSSSYCFKKSPLKIFNPHP